MIEWIIKRDGSEEPFLPDKLNGWAKWAAENLGGFVDWAGVAMRAVASLPEKASSQELQLALIQECKSQQTWAYYRMAARLYIPYIRKQMYGGDGSVPPIQKIHQELQQWGLMRVLDYTDAEYEQIEQMLEHKRDFNYAEFQIKQIIEKYSLCDRRVKSDSPILGRYFESPQHVYMRMAMALAEDEPRDLRMHHVSKWYSHLSCNRLNAPTPNFANLGTTHNGLVSCCLIASDDREISIGIHDYIARAMTVASAGIGTTIVCRSIGDPVRGGLIVHGGKIPYYRSLSGAVNSSVQNGRGGACTTYFSCYDPEVMTLMNLRHPKSPEDKRILTMDFAVCLNKHLYRKAAANEDVFLFNAYTAPDLVRAFYDPEPGLFEAMYERYEQDQSFKKEYFSARKIIIAAENIAIETGSLYQFYADEANRHTPFYDPIYSSNLCVAPETMLLTDKGEFPIASLIGQSINVWNGEEFSNSQVVKTGENVPLWTVLLTNGKSLDCTEYHKWYIVREYGAEPEKVETSQLYCGAKLIKFGWPVIEGQIEFDRPYLNGFYTGDGTELGENFGRVYLYGEKKLLKDFVDPTANWRDHKSSNRFEADIRGLQPKFTVPNAQHTVKTRLEWLAGWLDADGCIHRNGTNESITACSVDYHFLQRVRKMLEVTGVTCNISKMANAGWRYLPTNDGSGDLSKYYCQSAYRLLITSGDSQKLLALGLKLNRLKIEVRETQREASQFVCVADVIEGTRITDTYCVTEPKRHMAVFNGILTGNCNEVFEPTAPYFALPQLSTYGPVAYTTTRSELLNALTDEGDIKIDKVFAHSHASPERIELLTGPRRAKAAQELRVGDRWVNMDGEWEVTEIVQRDAEPEVALCSLAAIVPSYIESEEQYADVAYYALKMIDKCIHLSDFPLPHIAYTARQRLSAGVGLTGVAHYMARRRKRYTTIDGKQELHRLAERHAYHLIRASLRLGKELGNAPWIHRTKWPEGWLPLDTYCKKVDEIAPFELQYDWETLRQEIIDNGGIRNSTLIAHMPTESSSKASGVPNGLYPIRDFALGKSDNGKLIDWAPTDGDRLKRYYDIAWDVPMQDQIDLYAINQKWTDQGISGDNWIRLEGDSTVLTEDLVKHSMYKARMGIKGRYYYNSKTSKTIVNESTGEETVVVVTTEHNTADKCTSGGCDA